MGTGFNSLSSKSSAARNVSTASLLVICHHFTWFFKLGVILHSQSIKKSCFSGTTGKGILYVTLWTRIHGIRVTVSNIWGCAALGLHITWARVDTIYSKVDWAEFNGGGVNAVLVLLRQHFFANSQHSLVRKLPRVWISHLAPIIAINVPGLHKPETEIIHRHPKKILIFTIIPFITSLQVDLWLWCTVDYGQNPALPCFDLQHTIFSEKAPKLDSGIMHGAEWVFILYFFVLVVHPFLYYF